MGTGQGQIDEGERELAVMTLRAGAFLESFPCQARVLLEDRVH